jgi:hypothetical protein
MGTLEDELKRLQDAAFDAAKIGARELKRGVELAKSRIEKLKLVQQRKEFLAELGLVVYEFQQQGTDAANLFQNPDVQEILSDLENCDKRLAEINDPTSGSNQTSKPHSEPRSK